MAKWVMILSEFDIEYVDKKEIQWKFIADQLVETSLYDGNLLYQIFGGSSIHYYSFK